MSRTARNNRYISQIIFAENGTIGPDIDAISALACTAISASRQRLSVKAIDSLVRSAADGHGVVRVLSCQVEQEVRDGRLVILLEEDEPEPLLVHLVMPDGRSGSRK
jgi:DNA-binding transcriptional LysR family regulator